MLSDIFTRLQNKTYYDTRDFPVMLTEEHEITNPVTDNNRRILLSEKCHTFDSILLYRLFKSSSNLNIRLAGYDKVAINYTQIDVTINYLQYDSTGDEYTFNFIIYRGDTYESQSKNITITGELGSHNVIHFDTIQGNFSFIIENFVQGAKVILSCVGYESAVLVIDSLSSFIGQGITNNLYFNVPANSLYINELPVPFNSGNVKIMVKYLGIGSVITAEALNDIINVVKYYNMLPKFDVEKINNNDIKLYIRGEYYYMGNYVEKIDDAVYQLEDEVMVGFQNAIVGMLDVPNHIFNIRRIGMGTTYNDLIADMTNFINENPDYEVPIFIVIFDPQKNPFEQTYVYNTFGSGGAGGVKKYEVEYNNVVNISFSLLNDKVPLIECYEQDGNKLTSVIPNVIEVQSNLVEIIFNEPATGIIVAVN